jgi:hypothetical protein
MDEPHQEPPIQDYTKEDNQINADILNDFDGTQKEGQCGVQSALPAAKLSDERNGGTAAVVADATTTTINFFEDRQQHG